MYDMLTETDQKDQGSLQSSCGSSLAPSQMRERAQCVVVGCDVDAVTRGRLRGVLGARRGPNYQRISGYTTGRKWSSKDSMWGVEIERRSRVPRWDGARVEGV